MRRWSGLVAVLGLACAGCEEPRELPPAAKPLIAVPRAAVPNIYTYKGATGYALARAYPGDIIAVVGHGFDPIWIENEVTLGDANASVRCPVIGYREIDAEQGLGVVAALYISVPTGLVPAPAVTLRVRSEGIERNPPTSLAIHRLAYAIPSVAVTAVATDLSATPPTWAPAHDFNLPATPDTCTLTPDGRFACCTSGSSVCVVLLADGQVLLPPAALLAGVATTSAISPDGRTLVLGVVPASSAPELAVLDLSVLLGLAFNVDGYSGLVSVVGATPALPPAARVPLGGSFPGRLAITTAGTACYATLSSGVVREWAMPSAGTLSFVQDIGLGAGSAPFGISITPDDSRALVTDLFANTLTPIDLAPVRVRAAISTGASPTDVICTPDGRRAVVMNAGGQSASVFDVAPGVVLAHTPPTLALGFAPGPAAGAPERSIGQGAGSRVVVVDGNQLRFLAVDANGMVTLEPTVAGPFAQSLRGVSVSGG